ncbi:hypothetical protein H6G89_14710 [Oscillatoria sp. FACHB-1407]|uniref:hypothetical protein n=1 Tax=Oscillatoria sp. FACHB-1407 TaxID=2692847 RepID=UPI0016877AF4|nr:hypothetical protein [Oscillatoria sp. FACHB-1407]MBD2462297.1 hypothetical protein [Oscillatoria sp. FACHB-1407]
MTGIYIELPNDLYDLLTAHLENSQDDLYTLVAQAITAAIAEGTAQHLEEKPC